MNRCPARWTPRTLSRNLPASICMVLATVDRDGAPSTAFVAWVVARADGAIALALDRRSSAYRNLASGSRMVACELLGDDIVLSLRGRARIERERMRSAPFPCALATIAIEQIRDHAVGGVDFRAPHYAYAPGKQHRMAIERAVRSELSGD